MNIILLGAPGAGKGTQAEVISKFLSIPTISTGNIIREALKDGSELGKMAKLFIEAGELVPDEVVINIIKQRLKDDDCKNGFILDGFPRTITQAEALDKMNVNIDKVICIDVDDEKIISRMSGRRVCKDCGSSFHLEYKKPNKDGICNECAGTLIQRTDDRSDIVKERLKIYHKQTAPLEDYYKNQNKFFVVIGQEKVEDTTKLTLEVFNA